MYADSTSNDNDLTEVNGPSFSGIDIPFGITSGPATTYAYAGTSYANPHAVTSYGSNTFTYDSNGNLLSTASTTNTWDWRNRLARTVTGTTTNYLYDESDQRVQYNLASSSATTTIQYCPY